MATRKENTEQLAKMMKSIDIAMFTTVGRDGYLVSRPLSTQSTEFDGERVWFFSEGDSPKIDEIARHPKINLAYASKDRNTYISVAGDASVNRDHARIDQFWNDALKAFFPEGKEHPNLVLIEVEVRTVEYWDGPSSWIGKALTFAIARVTGNDDVMGENRIVDVPSGRSRKAPTNSTRPRKTAKAVRKASSGLAGTEAKKAARKIGKKSAKSSAKKTAKSPAKESAKRKGTVATKQATSKTAKKPAARKR